MALFSILGGLAASFLGSRAQTKAAEGATDAQLQASREGIAELRRQSEEAIRLQQPFVEAGTSSVGGLLDLVGLGGQEAEAAAIARLEESPRFQAIARQGEEAILQNAAATGGLRGGNTQAALAQFRPQLLNQQIEQQFSRLGQITQLGQASASGTAAAGLQTGRDVSNLLLEGGQAQAQGLLAQGQNRANLFGDIGSATGQLLGLF